MQFRASMLSWLFAVATGVSMPAIAQNAPPIPAPGSQPAASDSQPPPGDQAQAPARQQPAADEAPTPAKSPEIKHAGGKNDVDAIGNRKLDGFDAYSIETDIKIGKAYSLELERRVKLVNDPVVNEYVNRIGQNLARNSDAKIPFIFKVVDDDEINALALPGGFLYVNSGLILAADDEAELAGAMAHEVAHVALRHGTRAQTRTDVARLMSLPLLAVGGPVSLAGLEAARIGVPLTFLMFARSFEAEADYFGIQYMYKAGYDPGALVTFFEKIQALEKHKAGKVAKVFATHPLTPDRIKKSQKEIATILPARDYYVETTSEFSEIKGRLAMMRNRLKMADASENKPVLQRAPGDAPATTPPGDEKKKEDDKPRCSIAGISEGDRVS